MVCQKATLELWSTSLRLSGKDPVFYSKTYIYTYLREEILQEGLTRNLQAFARFLETASFSPAMKSGSS